MSCSTIDKGSPANILGKKKQILVVIDKTASVNYQQRMNDLKSELRSNFNNTYDDMYDHIQVYEMIINGNTKVFPSCIKFTKQCPNVNPESRSETEDLEDWKFSKKKWLQSIQDSILTTVKAPCNSNRTDIFGVFEAIQEVQKSDGGHWDSIEVFICSDMVHTLSDFNMLKMLNTKNAFSSGKTKCDDLINDKKIKKLGKEQKNIKFEIYTPPTVVNSSIIRTFWQGFFQEWGLPDLNYSFQ
jgi:hypothetical protein